MVITFEIIGYTLGLLFVGWLAYKTFFKDKTKNSGSKTTDPKNRL